MRLALTPSVVAKCRSRRNVDDVSSAQEFEARILVVEDDPEARATLELLLGAKWAVTAVERGDVARDTARAVPFASTRSNVIARERPHARPRRDRAREGAARRTGDPGRV